MYRSAHIARRRYNIIIIMPERFLTFFPITIVTAVRTDHSVLRIVVRLPAVYIKKYNIIIIRPQQWRFPRGIKNIILYNERSIALAHF